MTGPPDGEERPKFSILVGLASTSGRDRILDLLEALRNQDGGHTYEALLADRRNDAVSRVIASRYTEAILIAAPPTASLPELRTLALRRARGEFVAVVGDRCVPELDWLEGFARAFRDAPERVVAVGGSVLNGARETLLDWATFYCEYARFLPPVQEGLVRHLPGINVCYRRRALEGIEEAVMRGGFWEHTCHPRLLDEGHLLCSTGLVRVRIVKPLTLGEFLTQRFLYSRHFAGSRLVGRPWGVRAAASVLALPLPLLLLARQARFTLPKRGHRLRTLLVLPYLACFFMLAAAGEMTGHLLGPGRALERLE